MAHFGVKDGSCVDSLSFMRQAPDVVALNHQPSSETFVGGLFVGDLKAASTARSAEFSVASESTGYIIFMNPTTKLRTLATLGHEVTPDGRDVWYDTAWDAIVPC